MPVYSDLPQASSIPADIAGQYPTNLVSYGRFLPIAQKTVTRPPLHPDENPP
jgi:hypothetical protein